MNNIRRDVHTKQSDLVFGQYVENSEKHIRRSNAVYNVVRKASLSLGITIAVALPLSMLPADSEPSEGSTNSNSTLQFNNYYQPESGSYPNLDHEHQHDHVQNPSDTPEVIVVPTPITINSVPPLNREWHRSVFQKVGDRLWALPNVNFVISLANLPGAGCNKNRCMATFTLRSDSYLAGVEQNTVVEAFSIPGSAVDCTDPDQQAGDVNRCMDVDGIFKNDVIGANCQINSQPLVPVTHCRFSSAAPGVDDLCLWLRRSIVPEQPTSREVALDVKWKLLAEDESQCQDWSSSVPYRE